MIRCILAAVIYLVSFTSFACTMSAPTDSPLFCSSFKVAATCYCTTSGFPLGMCQNMQMLFNRMVSVFGSLQAACLYQQDQLHYTSAQECIDNWTCYLQGGIDSKGRLCKAC